MGRFAIHPRRMALRLRRNSNGRAQSARADRTRLGHDEQRQGCSTFRHSCPLHLCLPRSLLRLGMAIAHDVRPSHTYEQSSRMVEPSLELAACKPMSVLMVRALCRELVKCMGTARDGGLGVAAPPGHVTANTCVTVITV